VPGFTSMSTPSASTLVHSAQHFNELLRVTYERDMVVDGLRGLFMAAIDVTNKGDCDWDRNDCLFIC